MGDAMEKMSIPIGPDYPVWPKTRFPIRKYVGILAYTYLVRGPAESMSLHAIAKHMHRPHVEVVRACMHIVSYTLCHREPLIFVGRTDDEKRTSALSMNGWSDASLANYTALAEDDPVDHRAMLSYRGSLIRLYINLIMWKSFMPKTVA